MATWIYKQLVRNSRQYLEPQFFPLVEAQFKAAGTVKLRLAKEREQTLVITTPTSKS